jgi:hypothetical protein
LKIGTTHGYQTDNLLLLNKTTSLLQLSLLTTESSLSSPPGMPIQAATLPTCSWDGHNSNHAQNIAYCE